MIFKPELAQRILTGEKTQTRRLVKSGEYLYTSKQGVKMVVTRLEAVKWQVGQTYAIQPGRTKAAIGRVKLLDIRRERMQDISEADVIAEGFGGKASLDKEVWVLVFEVVK